MIGALMRLLTFFLDGESFCEQIRKTDRTAYLPSGDARQSSEPTAYSFIQSSQQYIAAHANCRRQYCTTSCLFVFAKF